MKKNILVLVVASFAINNGAFSQSTIIDNENIDRLITYNVFKKDRTAKMSRDSDPFMWLTNKIKNVENLDRIEWVELKSIDNYNPTGNNTIINDGDELIFQIPEIPTKNGNGLDYQWFSLVWGIEYHKRKGILNNLIKSLDAKEITKEILVKKLVEIRVEVILEVGKFDEEVWLPWCLRVGALPSSGLIWMRSLRGKDRQAIIHSLRQSGDILRITNWVNDL